MTERDHAPRSFVDRLEHPLPAGMRDLLPEETATRRGLSRIIERRLAAYGYRLVTPPAFELADVVERGLGPLAAGDVLRFVEPESGEVCVLRPDLTPQIARIVATRLREKPPPHRIAYEGTVVRRRLGRARKSRQTPQVGVELCGLGAPEGDLEVLELACDVLRAAGLVAFTVDIADAGIVRGLLEGVDAGRAEAVMAALAKKDEVLLAEAADGLPHADALAALTRLHGDRAAMLEAARLLAGTPARAAAERLLALFDAASARGLADVLRVDAGEVRGFAYYTGLVFSIYAHGHGDALGSGGRYDELLGRFGAPMPAVGFGLDLDALASVLGSASVVTRVPSVVVVGVAGDPRVATLRAGGIGAVTAPSEEAAVAYARAWAFGAVLSGERTIDPGSAAPFDEAAAAALRVLESHAKGT